MTFRDRKSAGQQLAQALVGYKDSDPLVLALPRGGVGVAFEVASALGAPLDVIVVRKLGAPGHPELAIGAVVEAERAVRVLNEDVIQSLQVSDAYLQAETEAELLELRRRQQCYRRGRAALPLAGRTVIVVDDGIATGASIRAALRGVRQANPKRIVLAAPVAPPETFDAMRLEADEVVCLSTPESFHSVGQFYDDFSQTTDQEVIEMLDRSWRSR